ncbi:hypothetical protein EV356DRAFT_531320 [Viridothelium virens]|uniref:BZIP domain-containing protein n=1 Tax=Viridothelium virens TaxID=1048519 RepID=A0A6A6HEX5_VIRVR|nr:hypothetical protein EV356DRAFT_531320 [Viridothelium virens]
MSAYEKQSPPDHYSSENSDSRKKQNVHTGSKRASRAGTRSVTTLTAAQLERKRANDREAQRAIRQRTKDHIENLERRIEELTSNQGITEKLIQRNKELENENALLRSRLGPAGVSLGIESQEHGSLGSGMDTAGLGMALPSSGSSALQAMGQQRTTGTGTPQRQPSSTPTPSGLTQSDPWQQHTGSYHPTNPSPISRPSHSEMGQQSGIWRTDSNESDRNQTVIQSGLSSGVNYGYMVDSSGRPVPYRGDASVPTYTSPSLSSDYQPRVTSLSQDYKSGQNYQTRTTNQSTPDYSSSRSSSHLPEYQTGAQPTEYSSRAPVAAPGYHGRDLGGQTQAMSSAVGAYCPMPNPQPYLATAPPTQQAPGAAYSVQQGGGAIHPQQTGSLRYYDPNVG